MDYDYILSLFLKIEESIKEYWLEGIVNMSCFEWIFKDSELVTIIDESY